ncbi:MAG: TonB-dependent receptor [Prolixibacteraceae bacterium]|nr:TonB-dependent receptor [Prolixibacteraceae bacterium]
MPGNFKPTYCLLIGVLFFSIFATAQRSTLSGIVTDKTTGETLVGATVFIQSEGTGTTTNSNGFFSFPGIKTANIEVDYSFIGYEPKTENYTFGKGEKKFVEIQLSPSDVEIGQVDVIEQGREQLGDKQVEVSHHTLTPREIQAIPVARNDVFKAMRYMPGMEPAEPFSPLLSVRGSDPGENLIMLDGVTMYNPYHFMSSSGIFNMQTVKNVDMMLGGFGAAYGGRNAAVINISTKDGNNSGLHGEVHPTTSETKVFLEFPLGEKTTMMVAARANYDLIGNFMMYSNNYFYDMNLSVTHRFSPRHRFTLKYFGSRDMTNIDFNSIYKYMGNTIGMQDYFDDMSLKWINNWDNNIVTGIWKSVLAHNLFFKAQAYGSFHNADNFTEMVMNVEDVVFDTSTRLKSKVNDWCIKSSITYKPFYWNEMNAGLDYNTYTFANGSEVNAIDYGSAQRKPDQISAYAEDKLTLGPLQLRAGIRASKFENGNWNWEPRINAVARIGDRVKIKAAWGKYNQHIISMNTQEFEFNQFLDYYYPLDNKLPGLSYHYIAGADVKIDRQNTLSLDVYYKDIARTYTFDLLIDQFEAFALTDKIMAGSGKSYGMELLWKGRFGKFSGWASYTLSKSTRSYPHIMDGQEYDFDYDRRHSIKAVMNYQATKRISYSASFIAQSGVPRSVENTMQMFYMYEPLTGEMIYSPQYVTAQKNGVRMPWLLYLDFGLQKKVVSGFGKDLSNFFGAAESYLTVNVYNALFFRRNILYYIPAGGLEMLIPMGDNYFPMVSAGYTLKF